MEALWFTSPLVQRKKPTTPLNRVPLGTMKDFVKMAEKRRQLASRGVPLRSIINEQYTSSLQEAREARKRLGIGLEDASEQPVFAHPRREGFAPSEHSTGTLQGLPQSAKPILGVVDPNPPLKLRDIGVLLESASKPDHLPPIEPDHKADLSEVENLTGFERSILGKAYPNLIFSGTKAKPRIQSLVTDDDERVCSLDAAGLRLEAARCEVNAARDAIRGHQRLKRWTPSLKDEIETRQTHRFVKPQVERLQTMHADFSDLMASYDDTMISLTPHEARKLVRYRVAIKRSDRLLDETLAAMKSRVDQTIAARDAATTGLRLESAFARESGMHSPHSAIGSLLGDHDFDDSMQLSRVSTATEDLPFVSNPHYSSTALLRPIDPLSPHPESPLGSRQTSFSDLNQSLSELSVDFVRSGHGELSSVIIPAAPLPDQVCRPKEKRASTSLGFAVSSAPKRHRSRPRASTSLAKEAPPSYRLYKARAGLLKRSKDRAKRHWMSSDDGPHIPTEEQKQDHIPPFENYSVGRATPVS